MKKAKIFAVFLTAAVTIGTFRMTTAQVLLSEDFDYTSGDLITNHGWTAHSGSGTQAITVNNGGLSFNGYVLSGIGNAALVDNTGEDDNKTFATQTSGVFYTGFMVKVTVNSAGYFFHLGPNPIGTTYRAKVFTDATNHFGISVGSNTGTFATGTFTAGTTYLLVIKYEIVAGTSNDKVSLFIFDSSLPATEPASASVGPLTDNSQTDISPASVALRQYSSTQNFIIDGIRVASSWSDLTGVPVTAPSVQASDITFSNIAGNGMTCSWTNGDGAGRVVVISADTSITPPADGTDPTANPVYSGSGDQVVYNGSGNSVSVTGLLSNSPYWFRVFEYNGSGSSTLYCPGAGNNNPLSQATLFVTTAPIVTNPTAETITTGSAILGGTLEGDGGSPVTERGTIWSVTTPVTINNNKIPEGGLSTGVFSHLRTSLPAGTEIFFAAYAVNAIGTSLSPQSSFSTLALEPDAQVTGLFNPNPSHSSISITWNDNDGTQAASGFLVLGNTTGVFTSPVDGVPQADDPVLSDGTGRVNVSHTLQNYTWTNLAPSTTYYFAIFPYTNSGSSIDYKTSGSYPTSSATTTAIPVNTYAWTGADNAAWTTSTNWSPVRSSPSATDILVFNDGTTKTITSVPTQSVGKLLVSNNTKVTFQAETAAVITINGSIGTDLDIPAGCELNLSGINAISLTLSATATGSISGSLTFTNGAHRLLAGAVSSVTFNSTGTFKAGTGMSGSPFGSVAPYNAIVFASGSTYICQAGSNPFGASAPNSVTVFSPGSLFKLIASITPSFSGRTYGNFLMDAPGATITATGTSAVIIQDLAVNAGTLNFNVTGTPGHLITGNITVAGGASLNFSPTSAGTVTLGGSSVQALSGSGNITAGTLSNLSFSNPAGILMDAGLTIAGSVTLNSCLLTLNSGSLTLGPAANINGNFSAGNMIVATGTGLMKKEFPGAGSSFTFPVGDNTGIAEYSPVSLIFTAGTFTAGNYVAVNLANTPYPLESLPSSYLNRYWNLSSSGISGFTSEANFSYTADDIIGNESSLTCAIVSSLPAEFYAPANTSQHQLTASGLSGFGSFTGLQADRNLSIRLFLESLYVADGVMNKAQNGSGDQFPGLTADQVVVELHDAANYSTVVYSSGPVNLSTGGTVELTVPAMHSGSYYVTVSHRNSIATVSSNPVSFAGSSVNYDFSNASSKAYGMNMKPAGDGYYVFFGGDVNQDGIVDSGDMILVDNDGNNFTMGYIPSDTNGDGLVDSSDMMIVDNNGNQFISSVTP